MAKNIVSYPKVGSIGHNWWVMMDKHPALGRTELIAKGVKMGLNESSGNNQHARWKNYRKEFPVQLNMDVSTPFKDTDLDPLAEAWQEELDAESIYMEVLDKAPDIAHLALESWQRAKAYKKLMYSKTF